MDDKSQVIEWLGNNFPYVLAFIAILAALYWFALPFYKSFLSSRENSIKALKDEISKINDKYDRLKKYVDELEENHRKELEIERQKSALLMSFKDQAVGVFSVISKQFEIPLPKIILDEIIKSGNG